MCVFQGDIVDNIEQNVSKSVDHILVAKEQTKKAVRYQTKARKVMSFNLVSSVATSSCLYPWLFILYIRLSLGLYTQLLHFVFFVCLFPCFLSQLFYLFTFAAFLSPRTPCPMLGRND